MKLYDMQGDPALRKSASALEASGDYRILRRLPFLQEMWLAPTLDATDSVTLGIVDTETTGLTENDHVVEIAVTKLLLIDGQVADVTLPTSMLEDPGIPLSADVKRVTGLCDEDLQGQVFDEDRLAVELADCDCLVAFNAGFDSAALKRRFPGLRHPWICARLDYDWAGAGYSARGQESLLTQMGHFYDAHRAAVDAWALLVMIANAAPDGRAIAAHMVDRASSPTRRVFAVGAPYAVKDDLKARGYRWNPKRRVWTIDASIADAPIEIAALKAIHPFIQPVLEEIDWYNRHVA